MSKPFEVVSKFAPAGDQPTAIAGLLEGVQAGLRAQTLLGVTGSGKIFTIANVVDQRLAQLGKHSFLLDGDNVRHGLNASVDMLGDHHNFYQCYLTFESDACARQFIIDIYGTLEAFL